jgi:hypothetical protein
VSAKPKSIEEAMDALDRAYEVRAVHGLEMITAAREALRSFHRDALAEAAKGRGNYADALATARAAEARLAEVEREVASLRKPPCLACDVGASGAACSCTETERGWRARAEAAERTAEEARRERDAVRTDRNVQMRAKDEALASARRRVEEVERALTDACWVLDKVGTEFTFDESQRASAARDRAHAVLAPKEK